jgi:hypothetical protein
MAKKTDLTKHTKAELLRLAGDKREELRALSQVVRIVM